MSEIKKIAIVAVIWFVSLPFAHIWAGVMQGLGLMSSPFSVMAALFAAAVYLALSRPKPTHKPLQEEWVRNER
jgi:hypothetical protein